jgi:hypothetical protein
LSNCTCIPKQNQSGRKIGVTRRNLLIKLAVERESK